MCSTSLESAVSCTLVQALAFCPRLETLLPFSFGRAWQTALVINSPDTIVTEQFDLLCLCDKLLTALLKKLLARCAER